MTPIEIKTLLGDRTRSLESFIRREVPQLLDIVPRITGKFPTDLYIYLNGHPDPCQCGNNAIWLDFRRGFTSFCSATCARTHNMQTLKSWVKATYGVDHFSKTSHYKETYKKTCLDRFGVENAGAAKHIKEKKARKKMDSHISRICEMNNIEFLGNNYSGIRNVDGTSIKILFKCNTCQTEFQQTILNGVQCPVCFPVSKYGGPSFAENEIAKFIEQYWAVERNTRKIIPPLELDIYIASKSIAIEYCGHYWHSSKFNSIDRHLKKLEVCERNGISLITIFEDDWRFKRKIVEARLLAKLGILQRTAMARKCVVRHINQKTADAFMSQYHLQGECRSSVRLGLFLNEVLVSSMTFSKNRFRKEVGWEMIRFASIGHVVGGASKLLSAFAKLHKGEVCYSYADRRYSTGAVYRALGFEEINTTKPNYSYIDKRNTSIRHNRMKFTKSRLVKQGADPLMTENHIMEKHGYLRIYDCGSHIFRKML